MYKHKINRAVASETSESDSKFTVAQILSSMTDTAREAPAITPVSLSEGVPTTFATSSSANLLTPSTLASLEKTFELAVQSENNSSAAASSSSVHTTESGFIPPVVEPIVIDPAGTRTMGVKRESDPRWEDDLSSCSSNDPEWNPSTSKRSRKDKVYVPNIDPETYLMQNSRRPTGPRKERRNEALSNDELHKREVRRERNKVAAAKCRQRRVDQTNVLINETENLEEEKAELENEISFLMKEKDELQFLLDAHKPACHGLHRQPQPQPAAPPAPVVSVPTAVSFSLNRPSTLPLRTTQAPATTAPVAITTPSSGLSFSHMGLDALIDGHTGLTPLTGAPALPSCSTQVQQQQRNSTDSNSPNTSPNTSSNQLISL